MQPTDIAADATGARDGHIVRHLPARRAKTVHTAGLLSQAVRVFLDGLAEIIAEDLWSRAQEAPMTPAKRMPTARRRPESNAESCNLRPIFEQPTTTDVD